MIKKKLILIMYFINQSIYSIHLFLGKKTFILYTSFFCSIYKQKHLEQKTY